MNKYRNVPTVVDGVRFASKGEAQRWQVLKLLEKGGVVTELKRQVRYSIDVHGHHICAYVADFVYRENGYLIVEDFKGKETQEYKLKKKLMLACHDITIRETRRVVNFQIEKLWNRLAIETRK